MSDTPTGEAGTRSGFGVLGEDPDTLSRVRETELWARLEAVLGADYVGVWADTQALQDLQGRTVREALDAGVPCKQVWRAAWSTLELDARER